MPGGPIYVLPNHENYEILVTSQDGSQTRALLEASTADYALGMGWELQAGRFLTENDIETAAQVCVLGSGAATDLFGEASPVGQEVKVRYHLANTIADARCGGDEAQRS